MGNKSGKFYFNNEHSFSEVTTITVSKTPKDGILQQSEAQQPTPQSLDWWLERHRQKCLEKTRSQNIDLVFLGDSITQHWEEPEANLIWNRFYQHRGALNLGFSGDRTEHLLWRIEQGELDGLSPRLVVLLIGTNNTGHRLDPATQTAAAIKVILQAIHSKLPHTKILLLALFPRSAKPTQRMRVINDEINKTIAQYADNNMVFFLDINEQFLEKDGRLTPEMMPDFLHLNPSRYLIWATAMEPTIQQLLITHTSIKPV